MIPWETIEQAQIPGQNTDITLRKRGTEFSIRTRETELMNSRVHGSEEDLARLACDDVAKKQALTILVGGLGMGYTLAAALEHSTADSTVTVSELIPAVIQWNRDHLGHLAGNPLQDHRVIILQEDVADTISRARATWDAILLDVDNGPEGLTQKANDRLYSLSGLKKAFRALCPGGVLAIWSSSADPAFTARLNQCRFCTRAVSVRARKEGKGSMHTIWLAQKP